MKEERAQKQTQHKSLLPHRYPELQQGHADDVVGGVGVADRQRLGLQGKRFIGAQLAVL